MIKKLIENGSIDESKAPDAILGVVQGIVPFIEGMVVKNNPEWEEATPLIKDILSIIIKDVKAA